MVESTEKFLHSSPQAHSLQSDAANVAASELCSLIEQVNNSSDAAKDLSRFQALNADLDVQAISEILRQRQAFASRGIEVADEDILSFFLSTRTLEPEQILSVVNSVSTKIEQFRVLGEHAFSLGDWRSVQELERNFLEFGLTFDNAELLKLYQADTAEAFSLFREKIHGGLAQMLEVISQEGEELPIWLQAILRAQPGAEIIVLAETPERQAYKQLLMTFFDSLGLTNRRYLVEQVLDSWSYC